MAWSTPFLRIIVGAGAMAVGTYESAWEGTKSPSWMGPLGPFGDMMIRAILLGFLLAGFILLIWGMIPRVKRDTRQTLNTLIGMIAFVVVLAMNQLSLLQDKSAYLSTLVALLSGIIIAIVIEANKTEKSTASTSLRPPPPL